ncbi:transposase, partial [Amycolatopsis thermalba]|uniref:transposase n=1 Tax=Amycolatopsis thermalba TaxID=944492 RepID=UPI0019679668
MPDCVSVAEQSCQGGKVMCSEVSGHVFQVDWRRSPEECFMARRPRKYSPELKAEVVNAVLEGGLSYTEAARDFDLVAQTVHNWVTAEKKKRAEESP